MPEIKYGGTEIGGFKLRTLSAASETVAEGYYKATTLSTVDADLAVGNIKTLVNVFGKVGTLAPVYDDQDKDLSGTGESYDRIIHITSTGVSAGSDTTLLSITLAATIATEVHGFFAGAFMSNLENTHKLKLFIDGVSMGETGFASYLDFRPLSMMGHRSVSSGAIIVKLTCRHYTSGTQSINHAAGVFGACDKI